MIVSIVRGVFLAVLFYVSGALRMVSSGKERTYLPLKNNGDVYYVATVNVGGQSLGVIMDSGSLETVILSTRCQACGSTAHLYNPKRSHTITSEHRFTQQSYGSGVLLAQLMFETMKVGPISLAEASMWEVVDAKMALLQSTDFGGIFGLGPYPQDFHLIQKGQNQDSGHTSLQWHLKSNFYSICLGGESGSDGHLIFNDDAHEKHAHSFVTLPALPDLPWWTADLTDVMFGDVRINCGKCAAVIDSGTSLLAAPSGIVDTIRNQLEKLNVQCNTVHNAPDFTFKLAGHQFTLPASYYIGEIYGVFQHAMEGKMHGNTSACQALFQDFDESVEDVGQLFILGMPFFRRYYTVFSQNPKEMSFSEHDGCVPGAHPFLKMAPVQLSRVDASKVQPPRWLRNVPKLQEWVSLPRDQGSVVR
mmetsp:Transcript_29640/g.78530  ORF Transcript_29640/g.78530 Transcript_29640/m.78530 type:complete len:418 (-) Transcript_29640:210-1463(-)